MNEQYNVICEVYDELSGVDTEVWADYLCKLINQHSEIPTDLVLDAACGTGKLTQAMSDCGYDMTGIDISCGMLSIARQRCSSNVLLLNQDICDFELYGTVSAVICCLDSVNYLTFKDVERFLKCCHLYLDPNGLLIFDVNTEYKFKNIYADNDYILENADGSSLLAWSCNYDSESAKCLFSLTLFTEDENGMYFRQDEQQTEYCHSHTKLAELIEKCGFILLAAYDELSFKPVKSDSHRCHYICKNIKEN